MQALGKALRKAIPRSPRGEHLVWGLFLALSLFFLWSALSGPQGAVELMGLRASLEELEEKNRVLMRENQELEKEIYLLRNSPAFQEKVAREGYGYVYPGERVYSFSEPDSSAEGEAAEGGGSEERTADP
jgi:cell division protein FtsB